MSMPSEWKAKLVAEVKQTPSPTRSELRRKTAIAATIGLAVSALFVGRHGIDPGPREPFFLAAVAFIILSFAARTLFAATGSLWTSPRGTQRLVAMPYVVLAAVAVAYAQGPTPPHSLRGDVPCLLTTLALGGVFGVAILFARRGTEPLRPLLKGLLLASSSAAVAGAAVFLACPVVEHWHFAIGHLGGALAVGGLVGVAAARLIRA